MHLLNDKILIIIQIKDAISSVKDELMSTTGRLSPDYRGNSSNVQDIKHDQKSSKNIDLASSLSGGLVLSVYDTELYYPKSLLNSILTFLGVISKLPNNGPTKMIQPSMALGNCFAFKGDRGMIALQLARKAFLKSVTIDHIQNAPVTINNAPRRFSISVSICSKLFRQTI